MADHADAAGASRKIAIIDIGSNSLRLVVYAGPARAMIPIFNEKLMIGLGSSLATTGAIDPRAYGRGLRGLERFLALANAMDIADVRCVATAAVRDASNGADFIADAAKIGVDVRLLSGREEARASGYGVISAIPDADGIVADLGGGSLELVRVSGGATRHHSSFPLGVLRLPALRKDKGKGFDRAIAAMLDDAGWPGDDAGLPLYLVGGSWRAIARYDMMLARDPMPVVSGHNIPLSGIEALCRKLGSADLSELARVEGLTSARVATVPEAATLMLPLVRHLKSRALLISASGLREGLLFEGLPEAVRAQDPLIAGAAAEGARFARFPGHGHAIDGWIAPLFAHDTPIDRRLRLAACLLADNASSANPDYRPQRAIDMALHGQWSGIDLADRIILAQMLYAASGGSGRAVVPPPALDLNDRLNRATLVGLAIRLAQRLSGGAPGPLLQTTLKRDDRAVTLTFARGAEMLAGEQVSKRLRQLANALGLAPEEQVQPQRSEVTTPS